MIRKITAAMAAASALLAAEAVQDRSELGQLVAGLRQSLAENQVRLREYSWTETTEISLKGEVKKREQAECRYDAAGKVQKIPLGGPAQPKKTSKGLKGRAIANKLDDLTEYMDRVGSLIRRYVPPEPQAMKAAFEAGKVSVSRSADGGVGALVFKDYAKPGDEVDLILTLETKKIRSFQVKTYLDSPSDAVSLRVSYSTLDSGVSYAEQTLLSAAAREIQVKITNFGYQK